MSTSDHEFWMNTEKYHDLAKMYEQNIEVLHADTVTSRRMCPCLDYVNWCGHPLNGKAEYYEYRGESVTTK